MGWPLTNGSWGSMISRGVISVLLPLDVASAASVFARPRKMGELDVPDAIGEVEGKDWAPWAFWDISDVNEGDLDEIGTVRYCDPLSGDSVLPSAGLGGIVFSNSGGIWSGGGIGRPRAAATSWCSVHDSEKSLRPLQKGASRRSICIAECQHRSLLSDRVKTYHELSNDGLVEVLRAGVDTLRDQITSIDMLLLHTPFPFLNSGDPFLLQATSLSFLLRFPSMLERSHISVADTEERQIRAARAARPGTLSPMIGRASVVRRRRASMVSTGGRGGSPGLFGLGVSHDAGSAGVAGNR